MNTPSKIPTVALDSLGCKLNQAEIQQLARQLEDAGYKIVPADEAADIYILNTCSVTQIADSKSRHLLRLARRRNPAARMIAVGCYAHRAAEELMEIDGVEIVLGNDRKMNLPEILGAISAPKAPEGPAISGQEKRRRDASRTRAFLKIQDGCKNFCAYCIVPLVRSQETSVPANEILALVKELTAKGCREMVLTGTEIGVYQDNELNLEGLIRRILAESAARRIRVSSLQPHQVTPGLVRLWQNTRLCPHFHLSLQSGSDAVLKRMKRKYTAETYRNAVKLIRSAVPDAAITTDIIVGFPGETDRDIQATVDFCKAMDFARIHVFPFSPRPKTAAATMPQQIPDAVKKERSNQMLALAKESAKNFRLKFTGKTLDVLWEQCASGAWSGLTGNYIKVYANSPGELTNTITKVKISRLYKDGVWGEVEG